MSESGVPPTEQSNKSTGKPIRVGILFGVLDKTVNTEEKPKTLLWGPRLGRHLRLR